MIHSPSKFAFTRVTSLIPGRHVLQGSCEYMEAVSFAQLRGFPASPADYSYFFNFVTTKKPAASFTSYNIFQTLSNARGNLGFHVVFSRKNIDASCDRMEIVRTFVRFRVINQDSPYLPRRLSKVNAILFFPPPLSLPLSVFIMRRLNFSKA